MRQNSIANSLIIAAPKSGSGKTLITLALLRALKNQGVKVASAKVGPDYIDPAFHTAASGYPCLNIDPWAMRDVTQHHVLTQLQKYAPDLLLIEGVMGLFDGAKDGTGSTADLATALNCPVVLVVDVKGQSASAAAIVKGFVALREDVIIAGVLFNNVGSDVHKSLIAQAMTEYMPHMTVLGYLPRQQGLSLPERHLGLVQAGEHQALESFLEMAASWVASHCDLAKLQEISKSLDVVNEPDIKPVYFPPLGKKIAIARDVAFSFCYEGLLDHWRDMGTEISFFSPLNDEAPSEKCDAVYLPGGYPELHGVKLSSNENFLRGLREAAARGAFVFGECGGYMVLGQKIIDQEGVPHDMAGLLPVVTNFQKRKLHLGYRIATIESDCGLGNVGDIFKAHEFHYATTDLLDTKATALFACKDAVGQDLGSAGLIIGNVAGSFIHLIDQNCKKTL